jgi:predicted phosphodiesterase
MMRYAIISDVHGNRPALFAALMDARAMGVDEYIFAGDYYMCSPYLNEVIGTIRDTPNAHVIRGNEEDYLKKLAGQDQRTWTDGQFRGLYWCYREITQENHDYLASLHGKLHLSGEGAELFIAHSSSEFIGKAEHREFSSSKIARRYAGKAPDRQALLGDVRAYLDKDTEFQKALKALPDGIYIFGHTHVQWHAKFQNKLFINPGSCGLPLDGVPAAAYAILTETSGDWQVTERRVPYDVEAFLNDLKNSSLYSEAQVWCDVLAGESRTGFEHVIPFLHFTESYAKAIGDPVRPYSQETWSKAYDAWSDRLRHHPAYLVTEFHPLEPDE